MDLYRWISTLLPPLIASRCGLEMPAPENSPRIIDRGTQNCISSVGAEDCQEVEVGVDDGGEGVFVDVELDDGVKAKL